MNKNQENKQQMEQNIKQKVEVNFVFTKSNFKKEKNILYSHNSEIKNFIDELKKALLSKEIELIDVKENESSQRAFNSVCSVTKQLIQYPVNVYKNIKDLEDTILKIVIDKKLCVKPNDNSKYAVQVITPINDQQSQIITLNKNNQNNNIEETKVNHQDGKQNMWQPNNLNKPSPLSREHSQYQKTPIIQNVCDQDANYQKYLDQSEEIAKLNQQLEKTILENQQQRIQFEKELLIFKSKIKELKLKNQMLEIENKCLKKEQALLNQEQQLKL
ncbi:hypothetical protein TTHERM_00621030 (macronuclear) [Tetrahymena thermophila SB210]|uniref:Uncharacterized protein n=1 Tax=Tetrahymena thermophila (strain SB210) TaxID=312017 RepID=Q23MF6_TETTS|nr:hypothetical protein TTHERM_00621030 [Tetrahymena thermophila SB210]EAR97683.1 hypothetical protein TTHERM_00621030 [Tetrahymena thermophila SB210]|eukprot:XP_001017928.1 hypothetical protein TTHERM_00621030 [Tetrahymena thermophila SB210]